MQTQKNYKNVGMQILVPNNSVEPLNTTFSSNAKLSSFDISNNIKMFERKYQTLIFPILSKMFERKYQTCNLEGYSTELKQVAIDRISVLSKSGKPLMPCKPAKARKLIESGKARRNRNTRQRPKKFDNRNRDGFIAPSQKSKVDLRLKIIKELCKLYPITNFSVEDVKYNHYKKKWSKHFSTVEIGKTMLYAELRKLGNLHLFNGYETKAERERLSLKKISAKSKRTPESHSTDAIALASLANKIDTISLYPFYVWKFDEPVQTFWILLVSSKIGGFMNNKLSLHEYTIDNKRFTQFDEPVQTFWILLGSSKSGIVTDCYRLFNQKIMFGFEQKSTP